MVRELLLLLVHRGRLRRDEIAALMWPDKDEHAARNNLDMCVRASELCEATDPKHPRSRIADATVSVA